MGEATAPSRPTLAGRLQKLGRRLYGRLRRMSTATSLLLLLGFVCVLAALVPQRPVSPRTLAAWETGTAGPGEPLVGILSALGLFDVFGSWWFHGLLALMVTSLAAATVPRVRAAMLAVRRDPPRGHAVDTLAHNATWAVPKERGAGVHEHATALGSTMAGRGFNVRTRPLGQTGVQIAAERGHTREISSIIFHLSFYVLLVGIGISQVYSFDGQVDMTEGGTFTDTRLSYGQVKSGPGWALDDHRGFRVTLDDFAADFHPTGTPAEYTTTATVTTADGEARTERIRLNEPAHVDGMTLYVLRYGLAPRLRLTDVTTGQDIFRDTVRTRAVEGGGYIGTAMLRTGEDRQEAMQVALLPGDNYDPARPHDNLELVIDLYQGQLGLGGQSTPEELVPTWGQALTDQSAVVMGERTTLGDLEVEYLELPLWAGFQVSRQPGHGVLLLGAALLMASLPGALYSYRRRYWIDVIDVIDAVEPSGRDLLHVRLAGVALQRQERFTVEFVEIATALRGVDAPTIVPEVPVEREVSRV